MVASPMEKIKSIKVFFSSVVAFLFSKTNPLPPSPPSEEGETQAPPIPRITPDTVKRDGVIHDRPDNLISDEQEYDLAKIILGFSFPAAIALLILSHQTQLHLPSSSVHPLSFAVWLAFSASLLGILLRPRLPPVSKVMMQLGIASAAIAFSLLMAIMFIPTSLKWVGWSFCVIVSCWFFYVLYKRIRG